MARSAVFSFALLIVASESYAVQNAAQGQLSASAQAQETALESAWSAELEAQHKSPIERVIALLTQMKSELEKEAADEAAMYDKMVCWCETNTKEKTKAVADAEALDTELSSEIESRAAKFGEAATEVARLKKQIAADTASLKKATAIREKEAAAFSQTEKDLMQSGTNVKNAINVLSKHNSASLAQVDAPVMTSMRAVLRDLALKHELMTVSSSEHQRTAFLSLGAQAQAQETTAVGKSLLSALDARGAAAAESLPLDIAEKVLQRSAKEVSTGFLQGAAAPSSGSYAPQSGQIFGILNAMKDDFEKNLSQEQKDEMQAASDFKSLSAAKTAQIVAAKAKLDETEGEHASNQKALSDAKENLEMTREQRSKDIEFLRNLKLTCNDLDKQWAERSETRAKETTAVSEAIKVITADDSMDLLRKTAGFLQIASDLEEGAEARMRRNRAATMLREAAKSPSFEADDLLAAWHSRVGGSMEAPRSQLSTLAVSVSLDSFKKLKEMMDKMTADLKQEQQDEVDFKAHCEAEFDTTEKETFEKNDLKGSLEADIERLGKLATKLAEEIATAQAQIADTEVAIKKAGQTREGENAEFQKVVADQRATQAILKKALGKLEEFYKKAFLIQQAKSTQEPPVKFNKMKKNAGAGPVIGLIEQIIEDSKALESEAIAGEVEAQKSYETFVKDSNDLIDNLTESVSSKTKAKAGAEVDSEQAKSDLYSTNGELEALALYESDLHKDCDWTLKNFNIRQKARLDEMEAISQAKAILSGSQ